MQSHLLNLSAEPLHNSLEAGKAILDELIKEHPELVYCEFCYTNAVDYTPQGDVYTGTCDFGRLYLIRFECKCGNIYETSMEQPLFNATPEENVITVNRGIDLSKNRSEVKIPNPKYVRIGFRDLLSKIEDDDDED